MRTSEHFNLNLVEGADVVNPLVQDVPNYEAIDEQMYKNQSASIGTATEILGGTIHAITRANPNTNVFRFTATSRYTAGDTFTVDGVSVTGLMPNGTSIPDGGFIVGGTVLCSLVGQLLTVYTNGVAVADDSNKLGGELPSYYATADGLGVTTQLAQDAATIAQNLQTTVSEISNIVNSNKSVTATILSGYGEWKNVSLAVPSDGKYVLTYYAHIPNSNISMNVGPSESYYVNGNGYANLVLENDLTAGHVVTLWVRHLAPGTSVHMNLVLTAIRVS